MDALDLDAKRAARSEARREPKQVTLGGEQFTFPATCPLEVLDLCRTGQYRTAFFLLLGDADAVTRFFGHRPDDDDLDDILAMYSRVPESAASPPSSASNGRPSKRTSPATTG